MTKSKIKKDALFLLRQKAEVLAKKRFQPQNSYEELSPAQINETLYELCIHQVELEMQIEELQKTQEELENAKSRYFELFESAPIGYLTLDTLGKICETNLTASTLLGTTPSSLINQPLTQFIVPQDQDIYYFFTKDLMIGHFQQSCELRVLKSDNTPIWVLLTAKVDPSANGHYIQRITLTNISKLKHTERQLLHSIKFATLGVLSDRIGSDINQSLEIISATTNSLSELRNDPKNFETRANILQKTVSKIQKIVNRLNEFSSENSDSAQGRYSLAKKISRISLSEIIRATSAITEIKSQQNKVFISYNFEETSEIVFDEFEIEQVVIGLISNGIDAAKNQSEKWVKVHVYSTSSAVILEVTDSGAPISENIRTQIFQPFFSSKSSKDGLGLSLSIAKITIEKHGASISILSNTKNTCFQIIFKI